MIKRGLVPSLLALTGAPLFPASVVFNAGVLFVLAGVAVSALTRCRAYLDASSFRLLAALVLLSPLTFLNYGYDFGRYDPIDLLLLIAALVLIARGRIRASALLVFAAILIHEAFVFYALPLLVAFALERARPAGHTIGRRMLSVLPLVATAGAALLVLHAFGAQPMLVANADPGGRNPLLVWQRSPLDNVTHVFGRWASGGYGGLTIVVLAAVALAIAVAYRAFHRANGMRLDMLALSPLGVLPLFAIGTDYPRWLSLAWTLCLIVIVIRILERRVTTFMPPGYSAWIALVPLLAFPLGPIGFATFFPMLSN